MSGLNSALPPPAPILPEDERFSRGIKRSLIFHAIVFSIIILKSLVFPGKPLTYVSSLRVDLVGLPDTLKKDLTRLPKPVDPTQKLTEEVKQPESKAKEVKTPTVAKSQKDVEQAKPDEMVLKPKHAESPKDRQNRLKNSLARIKSLAKITSEAETMPTSTNVAVKGNILSKGTSLSGDAKESAETSYFDLVRDRLQENWALPVWLARQKLSAQIQVFIDSRGRLAGSKFIKSSGNAQFDDSVKKTLTESQPFPVPPSEIASSVLVNGILVGFPL